MMLTTGSSSSLVLWKKTATTTTLHHSAHSQMARQTCFSWVCSVAVTGIPRTAVTERTDWNSGSSSERHRVSGCLRQAGRGAAKRGWLPGRHLCACCLLPSPVPGALLGRRKACLGKGVGTSTQTLLLSAQQQGQQPEPGHRHESTFVRKLYLAGRTQGAALLLGNIDCPTVCDVARYVNPCLGILLCTSHQMVLYIQT